MNMQIDNRTNPVECQGHKSKVKIIFLTTSIIQKGGTTFLPMSLPYDRFSNCLHWTDSNKSVMKKMISDSSSASLHYLVKFINKQTMKTRRHRQKRARSEVNEIYTFHVLLRVSTVLLSGHAWCTFQAKKT